ncbi:mechanosensitive ion channel domain-containing protein [Loktanella agnita]|uniref:mechanosensitive ion channel domain-containing protein n=1 Tax=Loktanella agnita TaxID=287097 RepID=UPI003989B79B
MRFIALLILVLHLALPVFAQDNAASIATVNSAQQDADIAVRLREILDELGNYDDVTVTVNEGVVTLRGTATSSIEAAALEPLAYRLEGVVAVRNSVVETADISARLDPAIARFKARLDQLIAFLPLALIAVALFALIVFVGFILARMRQPWDRLAPNAFIAELYRQLIRIVFVIIGIVIALDVLNATALLSTILGAAGIIGLALGFAVRDTVENYIASVMLSIRQPFSPNDAVEINGDTGKVIKLTSRATVLLSFDGNHIRIPNATVFKSRIINYSRNPERRFDFQIGVASDADLSTVRDLAERTVTSQPFTLEIPAPAVWIDRIGDGAIFLTVTGWIDQRDTDLQRARGETLRLVKEAIEAAGVEVPDTTYRVQMLGATTAQVTESDRAPHPSPPTKPTAQPADVTATGDEQLENMIDAERQQDTGGDLLSEDAPKE